MSEDTTRLNIERARAALARARMDDVAAAVRAPRPADLSRLQEEQARLNSLNTRTGAFRDSVRERLGLGAYSGDGGTATLSPVMDAPLCDAAVCAPAAPKLARTAAPKPAPAKAPPQAEPKLDLAPEPKPRRRKFLGLF